MTDARYDQTYFSWYTRTGRLLRRPYGDNRTYRYWVDYLRQRLPAGGRVLEVGCGVGFFGARVAKHFRYVGLDIAEEALEVARRQHGLTDLHLADVQQHIPADDASCDAVVAFDVIEHLSKPDAFFAEVARVMRGGGYFIATTPNPRSLGNRIKRGDGRMLPSMYKDKTHVSLLTRAQWVGILERAGLRIERAGSDCLWDLPYVRFLPTRLQVALMMPFNLVASRYFPLIPWTLGENHVLIARKPG